jgi:rhodanese-related sulfurtransferase
MIISQLSSAFFKRRWCFIYLALMLPLNALGGHVAGSQNINSTKLQELLDSKVPLYDVRRNDEWHQTGIIQGARTLTFVDRQGRIKKNFLKKFTAEVDKDQPVIVMCRTGNRSDALTHLLVEKYGYTQVYNLRDGIVNWIYEKKPVVNP